MTPSFPVLLIASVEMSDALEKNPTTSSLALLGSSFTLHPKTQTQPTFDGLVLIQTLTLLTLSLPIHFVSPPISIFYIYINYKHNLEFMQVPQMGYK